MLYFAFGIKIRLRRTVKPSTNVVMVIARLELGTLWLLVGKITILSLASMILAKWVCLKKKKIHFTSSFLFNYWSRQWELFYKRPVLQFRSRSFKQTFSNRVHCLVKFRPVTGEILCKNFTRFLTFTAEQRIALQNSFFVRNFSMVFF